MNENLEGFENFGELDGKSTGVGGGSDSVGQEQIHDLLFKDKLGWQAIIYDLINTEQLDPWDIDISLLVERFLERIHDLEGANFFVSSKVLLAASLLLRIKSEVLLNHDLRDLDDVLFGNEKEKRDGQERIELEDDIPELVPRTPLPRSRKVTLPELMAALGKAIKTENRRIKREIVIRQQERETGVVVPRGVVNLQVKIRQIHQKLKKIFSNREERFAFSELVDVGKNRNEGIYSFVSLLHLDNQQKIWLEQDGHFEEIWILLKHIYEEKNKERLAALEAEVERAMVEEETEVVENLEKP